MKTFILKGVPINRLLDGELQSLQEAKVEVAITNNNDKFGIDNKTDMWPCNTNSIVFMWPEDTWKDGKDWVGGLVIANVIKNLFEYREDINWKSEWDHLANLLGHMNPYSIMIYNITTLTFE